ncbi:MAG: hypothetical protein ACWA5P_04675 [bacterium]
MKLLYNINKYALVITLVLYLTIFLGLYAQIVLGIIQVLTSLILILAWKEIDKNLRKQLIIYWSISVLYGLFWNLDWHQSNNTFLVISSLMVFPMSIAIYFFYILNSIKKTNHENTNS